MATTVKKVVYIVDDEEMITSPLERLLNMIKRRRKLNFDIQTANDPVQALSHIGDFRQNGSELALVVADIMMPQMNGLNFLQEVRQYFPLAPQIVLTGYADKDNAIKALNSLDLFFYLEKPWNNDEFSELILRGLQKHRQDRIEAMFGLYVPGQVIEFFIDRSDTQLLEGKEVQATVLFLDIVDFTRKSEAMEPRHMVHLLNRYFTEMVDVIHAHHGMLDKYTGDGLMALFGVPDSAGSPTEDARNGVLAAVDIINCVQALNDELAEENVAGPPLRIRMGINSGPMVVGNIGSFKRVNYTAVSDVVNTAARIEDAARHYMADEMACMLISQQTHDFLNGSLDQLHFEAQPPVTLRGKTEETIVYKAIATGL